VCRKILYIEITRYDHPTGPQMGRTKMHKIQKTENNTASKEQKGAWPK